MPGPLEGMPQVACKLLKDHSTIRELEINLFHMNHDESSTSNCGIHMLCQNLEPSRTRIHTLDLAGVNLNSSHKLLSALHLPVLASLTIPACNHTEVFLAALCKSAEKSLVPLKWLTIHHSQAWDRENAPAHPPAEPILTAIDSLLAVLPRSLQRIWICLRGFRTLPLVEGLASHGSTLRWLFIDVRTEKKVEDPNTYTFQEWQTLCKSLKTIRQLDMVFPDVEADCSQHEGGLFEDYIVSLSAPLFEPIFPVSVS